MVSLGPEQIFYDSLSEGRISIQRCEGCRTYIFFPRLFCYQCGSDSLSWTGISGKATIYSFTVISRGDDKGGSYHLLLVDLNEGPRMVARFPQEPQVPVEIGMQVQLSAGKLDEVDVVLATLSK
jgi:uncharacterized protein